MQQSTEENAYLTAGQYTIYADVYEGTEKTGTSEASPKTITVAAPTDYALAVSGDLEAAIVIDATDPDTLEITATLLDTAYDANYILERSYSWAFLDTDGETIADGDVEETINDDGSVSFTYTIDADDIEALLPSATTMPGNYDGYHLSITVTATNAGLTTDLTAGGLYDVTISIAGIAAITFDGDASNTITQGSFTNGTSPYKLTVGSITEGTAPYTYKWHIWDDDEDDYVELTGITPPIPNNIELLRVVYNSTAHTYTYTAANTDYPPTRDYKFIVEVTDSDATTPLVKYTDPITIAVEELTSYAITVTETSTTAAPLDRSIDVDDIAGYTAIALTVTDDLDDVQAILTRAYTATIKESAASSSTPITVSLTGKEGAISIDVATVLASALEDEVYTVTVTGTVTNNGVNGGTALSATNTVTFDITIIDGP